MPAVGLFYLPALWASGRAASYPLHGKSAVGDKCDVGWVGTGSRNIGGKFDKKRKEEREEMKKRSRCLRISAAAQKAGIGCELLL